jgi:hypothetical protein
MCYWETSTRLHTEWRIIERGDLEIKLGIFQGDPLSPLLIADAPYRTVVQVEIRKWKTHNQNKSITFTLHGWLEAGR